MDLYTVTTQQILEQIARHCPSALPTYLQCMNRVDQAGKVFFSKAMVQNDLSESWTKFKNQVKKLAIEGLLEWHPFNGGISVTLAALDENE